MEETTIVDLFHIYSLVVIIYGSRNISWIIMNPTIQPTNDRSIQPTDPTQQLKAKPPSQRELIRTDSFQDGWNNSSYVIKQDDKICYSDLMIDYCWLIIDDWLLLIVDWWWWSSIIVSMGWLIKIRPEKFNQSINQSSVLKACKKIRPNHPESHQ